MPGKSNPAKVRDGAGDTVVGTVLGECRVEKLLGQGGMGAVYKAHHVTLDKPVAVKVLSPIFSMDEDYQQRFLREARAAAKLEHPNIVQVYGCHAEEGNCYIILQYIEGQSVEQLIRNETKVKLDRATRIVRDVVEGLIAAHGAGIIHRDIKPANILLTKDEVAKIADFGLARSSKKESGITVEGAFVGTPEYVSPEQAQGRPNVDPRTDLYSLGVTYYRMLSGKLPFEGNSPMDLAAKHLRDEPPPLDKVAPGLDPRAIAITHRLLQKKPADRFGTARELAAELDGILSKSAPPTKAPPRTTRRRTVVPRPAAPQGPRGVGFWGLAALAGLFAFLTGAMGASTPPGDYLASLARPFVGWWGHVALSSILAFLAVGAFVLALRIQWKGVASSSSPGMSIVMFLLSGVCLYAAGVHAPPAEGSGMLVWRAAKGGAGAWPHPAQFGLGAGLGLLTGLALGGRPALKGTLLALSLAAALSFGAFSAGHEGALFRRPTPYWVAGAAGLCCAAAGLRLVLSRRGDRLLGAALVVLAAAGLYAFGVPVRGGFGESLAGPFRGMPEALARHGGTLTAAVALAAWSTWLLRTPRSEPD